METTKYIRITFDYGVVHYWKTNHLNGYTKNRVYETLGSFTMYTDHDKLEEGKEKFKKYVIKHYNDLIDKIETI